MTVIDEVLAVEKASEQKLQEATATAAEVVLAAKKTQSTALEAEKKHLQEVEETQLSAHQSHVDTSAEKIAKDAQAKIDEVEKKFADASANTVKKIKDALS